LESRIDDKYTFCEGPLAADLRRTFDGFLFNEDRHLTSQSASGWITFSLVHISAKSILAQMHIHVDGVVASSPLKAPFGSIEFEENLLPEALQFFLQEIQDRLKQKGVKRLVIKDVPQAYRPLQYVTLSAVFGKFDFKMAKSEVNSTIPVDDAPWSGKISEAEQRRLRRCEAEELRFEQLQITRLREVYDFILACRVERGVGLSMPFETLSATVKACANDFLFFGVFQKNEMIAACISVLVTKSILYNFYPAHLKSADRLSPIVFLIDRQYTFCRQNGVHLIDLGTSMLGNSINYSLLNFKTNVGGMPSLKLTFEKEW
jgi:hypothetical protein